MSSNNNHFLKVKPEAHQAALLRRLLKPLIHISGFCVEPLTQTDHGAGTA
jgi:hypothetical protein